jgi:hypothetical protein
MDMGPGQPHDLAAIDRIGDETAVRSEQGAQLAEDGLHKFAGRPESRTASFGQGTTEGRQVPAITSASTYQARHSGVIFITR